jgi:hypothetical protein
LPPGKRYHKGTGSRFFQCGFSFPGGFYFIAMSKDTFYFSHDYNTRADDKIKGLIRKHGMVGYGVFWSIIEDLYNNANALHTDYEGIAYDLRVDSEMVKSIINDFDLFCFENGSFGSVSVEKRLDKRNDKSVKARKSAFKRWNKIESDANAMPPHSEGNAIKERKGKKRKDIIVKEEDSFNFYTEEVKKAKEFTDQMSIDYIKLCNHICQKNNGSWRLPYVLKMNNQITLLEFSKLYIKSGKNLELILTKIDSLQTNVKYHNAYTDLYLTINKWLNK